MPRLSNRVLTKGNAIWALLELYRSDPDFMNEIENLRNPYMTLIDTFSVDVLAFFLNADISSKEFYQAIVAYGEGKSEKNPLPYEQFYKQFPYFNKFQPYFEGLNNLVCRWNLRTRWAALLLFYCDIIDCWKAKGMPSALDIPLEKFDSLIPLEPPALPLTITIPAWAVVLRGRKAIVEEVAVRLKRYENQIKAKGFNEEPSALKKHARWWFEHHAKGKSFAELEKLYPRAGRENISQETIKRKVWEFSKLVGIKPC